MDREIFLMLLGVLADKYGTYRLQQVVGVALGQTCNNSRFETITLVLGGTNHCYCE